MKEGGNDDDLPDKGAANEIKDEPSGGGEGEEEGGLIADTRGLDRGDGQQTGDIAEDNRHDAFGADRREEGLLEERHEKAGERTKQGNTREPFEAGVGMTLRVEHVQVRVGMGEKTEACRDGQEDGRNENQLQVEVMNWRKRTA